MKEEHLERILLIVINSKLNNLLEKVNRMATVELDIENDLQAISDAIAVLAKEIADLKAAGVQLVTQDQLDALDAKAKAIAAAAASAV